MTDPITISRAQAAIENGLIEALQSQAQADMDGTTVIVSRQACDEAAEFLPALHDEVKRLRAEKDAKQVKRPVPAGQTPLDDKLNHRCLDVIREGEAARDAGTVSPYHGHSLEHCLHATGWVSRDLRLALDEARARAEKAAAEADHAARILSQIEAVPVAQVRAEALEEAAALPPYDGDGDPAGSFDHHVFVKRDAIRALIEKEPT